MMLRNIAIHTLSLLKSNNTRELEKLVSDVQYLKKIYSRALRLGVWRLISIVKWRILHISIHTLQRIRSQVLLNSLLELIIELAPKLLTRFEDRLLSLMESMRKILIEKGDNYLNKLAYDDEYLYTLALNQLTSERIGFTIDI